jgi:hypothetical protein
MLIREVTTTNPTKPRSAADQRVTALKSQLDQAREVARRQRLAARQVKLNQERAQLNKLSTNKNPRLVSGGFRGF